MRVLAGLGLLLLLLSLGPHHAAAQSKGAPKCPPQQASLIKRASNSAKFMKELHTTCGKSKLLLCHSLPDHSAVADGGIPRGSSTISCCSRRLQRRERAWLGPDTRLLRASARG